MGILSDAYNEVLNILPIKTFGRIQYKTLDMLEKTEEGIRESTLPTISLLLDQPKVLKAVEANKDYKIIKNALKISSFEALLKEAKSYCEDVISSMDKLEALVKDTLNNSVNHKTMSFKQYSVYRLVEDTNANSEYILRIVYLAMRNNEASVLPQKKVIDTLSKLSDFRVKVLTKVKVSDMIKEIIDLPNDSLYERIQSGTPEEATDNIQGVSKVNGFIGNPIFTFRKWWFEKDLVALEKLNDTKSMIELRLLELRGELEGDGDNQKLREQIEYYEDKLSGLDAKIDKIENSYK